MAICQENPTVDEVLTSVRSVKERLAEEMQFDVARILADARKKQPASGHAIVSPPNRPLQHAGKPGASS
jgi:hypothetical protein